MPAAGVRLPLSLLALGAVLEGKHDYRIVDGNLDPDAVGTVLPARAGGGAPAMVGITVMPGPQVAPAIEISAAVRAAFPRVPDRLGGLFPHPLPRGGDQRSLRGLRRPRPGGKDPPRDGRALPAAGSPRYGERPRPLFRRRAATLASVKGLTWKDGEVRHNPDRPFEPPERFPPLPYERVGDMARYLRPSFMGTRTAVHQLAIGCRYRCTFCGVVSMFNGTTR